MFRLTGGRAQARPSARTRRLQAAVAREERLRKKGINSGATREELARQPRGLDPGGRASEARRLAAGAVPIRRVLGIGMLFVIGGLLLGAVLLWQRADAFNRAVSTAPSLSSALLGPLAGGPPVNIAFIGYAGREGHGGRYLADSLNILSIDPSTNATTLIAIPRDLWVEGHPLFPENAKVNEAFAVGWDAGGVHEAGRAQTDVLEYVTGLPIDHWIALDFDGLAGVVDAVGGDHRRQPAGLRLHPERGQLPGNGFFDGGRVRRRPARARRRLGPGLRPRAVHVRPGRGQRLRPLHPPAAGPGRRCAASWATASPARSGRAWRSWTCCPPTSPPTCRPSTSRS